MINRREFAAGLAVVGVVQVADVKLASAAPGTKGSPARVPPCFSPVDAAPLGAVPDGALVLHDNWQMREEAICGSQGERFAKVGFAQAKTWYATSVPATAQSVLIRHGVYPDPYVGLNDMLIPDASDEQNTRYDMAQYSHLPAHANPWGKPYWFRTEFHAPNGFKGGVVWLHLDGINYRADVWLNGQQVGDASKLVGMFERFRLNVTHAIRPGHSNALAIRIHPLDYPGVPLDEQVEGTGGTRGPNGGDGEISRNVTQVCSVGWDWVPASRDRNMGIWQHVWLERTGEIAVRDVAGMPHLDPEDGAAHITVKCLCDNTTAAPADADLHIRIEPVGFAGKPVDFRASASVAPGNAHEVILLPEQHPELILQNPALWWPVSYGGQPLYKLTIAAYLHGVLQSTSTSKLGVREVGTYVSPSGGRAFTVNGRTIRMTGGAWVPDLLNGWSAQRYRDEVRLMAAGNHTIVRVNGCGIMPPEAFFDECDLRGLLVWQDTARSSFDHGVIRDGKNTGDPKECNAELLLSNMTDCIYRIRGHASMLLWCGCNERVPQQDFGEAFQNAVLPALDPGRPWIISSSADAAWEKERNFTYSHGPYSLVTLPEYFKSYATDPAFVSKNEIGLASPPPINTMATHLPSFEHSLLSDKMLDKELGFHDAVGHYKSTPAIIHSSIGTEANLNDLLWMADFYTGAAYRAIYEAANKARPRNSGTHLWKVNAAWPSMMWQVFDWYLHCNAGYYSMKSACRPLHVQYSADDATIQLVSTLAAAIDQLKISLQLIGMGGKLAAQTEWRISMPADSTIHVGEMPKEFSDGRLYALELAVASATGEVLDRTVTIVQRDCDFQDLLLLPPVRVTLAVKSRTEDHDEVTYHLVATNTSAIPAINANVCLLDAAQGEELLPSFWSDNAFTLLPGEAKPLTVAVRKQRTLNKRPHLNVEGWNILPFELSLEDDHPVDLRVKVAGMESVTLNGDKAVQFKVTQSHTSGKRIATWPLMVNVNGKPWRTIRFGIPPGQEGLGLVSVAALASSDQISLEQPLL